MTMSATDMTYRSTYDDTRGNTYQTLTWNIRSKLLAAYGPGRHIVVTVNFSPPLTVRHDHFGESVYVTAGYIDASCFDRSVSTTATVNSREWTSAFDAISCDGKCTTGAPALTMSATFESLTVGEDLKQVSFEFVVPDTYASGEPIPAGNLTLRSLTFTGAISGDYEGDPLVWPGALVPASN
jgi:hypothetical protein